MPRCQNTFRYLAPVAAAGGVYVCAHCDSGEIYRAVSEPDLLAFAGFALRTAAADFGEPADHRTPFLIWRGVRPECVYEPADRRYDLYLAADPDPWQARLQIGHEMFHRVAGGARVFHWTHEMLACLFSVRLLRLCGFAEYAARTEAYFAEEGGALTQARFVGADPCASHDTAYYGRAFLTGRALQGAAGYAALCRLARTISPAGQPDVNGWLASLGGAVRIAAALVLQSTEGTQL